MPRVAQRQIPIFYKPPYVGVMEIDKIILYYNNGIPIGDIIRRCQLTKHERDGKCLSYPDIYTILFHAMKDGRVKQRELPDHEMPIKDFPVYFQFFREGCTQDECWNMLSDDCQKFTSKNFHIRLFRAMGDRFREYQRRQVDLLDKTTNEQRERQFVSTLMNKFKRLSVGVPGKARPAIVLFLDELPLEFLNQLHQLDTDFSRGLLLALNPTMLSELEAHQVRSKLEHPAKSHFSKAKQQQLADDAVRELQVTLGSAIPKAKAAEDDPAKAVKPEPFMDPEDKAELDLLTPEQLEEAENSETQQRNPSIPLPSAHQPASQSPGFDIHNLVDNDPMDPNDDDLPNVVE